jgi:hypothetical protein
MLQLAVCELISLISENLNEETEDENEGEKNLLSHHSAQWIFALLAILDELIDADTQAALRAIMRHCTLLRSVMVCMHFTSSNPCAPLAFAFTFGIVKQ